MLDAQGARRLTVLEILRVARGWDRSDAAVAIGCARTSVGLWERGRVEPRPEMQRALERTFDAPWAVLRNLTLPDVPVVVGSPPDSISNLEIERRRRYVDVQSAAAACDVSPDVFRAAELGTSRPLPRNRERLEAAFGLPIAVLMQPARIDVLTNAVRAAHAAPSPHNSRSKRHPAHA